MTDEKRCESCGRTIVNIGRGIPAGTVREEIAVGDCCWGCVEGKTSACRAELHWCCEAVPGECHCECHGKVEPAPDDPAPSLPSKERA